MTRKEINQIVKIKEDKGRELFYFAFKDDYRMDFTEDKNCPYDATSTGKTNGDMWLVEIKCYIGGEYARPYNKINPRTGKPYPNYQIDYEKLVKVSDLAHQRNHIPILVVFFTDRMLIWNLDKVDWQSTYTEGVWCNDYGYDYGKSKSNKTPQAYLYNKDAVFEHLWENTKL